MYIDGKLPKLGKLFRHDERTLKLSNYLDPALPPPPAAVDWSAKLTSLGPMLNNDIGLCTCAGAGHHIQIWTSQSGTQVIPADSEVLAAYVTVTGYKPSDPSTDTGAVPLDVLNAWRQGRIFPDHPIGAYVQINTGKRIEFQQSVALFGGVYLGVELPKNAQGKSSWSVSRGSGSAPGSWGGHEVPIIAYDNDGATVLSWGMKIKATWEFIAKYASDTYCLFSNDWIEKGGEAPNGILAGPLKQDLAMVAAA